MTSAPVKDVSSLLNFTTNVSKAGAKNPNTTGGMNQTSGFGDVMSKTQSGNSGPDHQDGLKTKQDTSKVAANEHSQNKSNRVKPKENAAETAKASQTDSEKQYRLEEEAQEVCQDLTREIAKELDVSQEEVEQAMEELGLSVYSLFDSANLTQLIMQISGEIDMGALLTDENLFGSMQDLMKLMQEMKAELMQDLELGEGQLNEMLQNADEEFMLQQKEGTDGVREQTPQIVIEVQKNGETVELSADENGNVTKTLDALETQPEKNLTEQKNSSSENGNNKQNGNESEFHTGNALLDALLQNKTPVAEAVFEPVSSTQGPTTQDIMNQIMDYLKIQVKPDVEQLEIQLHPQNLGTVHVQLTSKGGEVTAQFQVQNETVKAAIESQIVDLKENLKAQGVKVEAVEVTVESHGFESNLWQGQNENASSENNNKKTPRRINLNELDALFEEEASEEEILAAKMMEVNGNTVDYTA